MCKSSCSSQVTVPGSVWHKCLLCTPGAGCDNSTLCSHRKALTPPQGGAAESLPSPDESLWLPSSSRLLSSLHSPGVLLSRGLVAAAPPHTAVFGAAQVHGVVLLVGFSLLLRFHFCSPVTYP